MNNQNYLYNRNSRNRTGLDHKTTRTITFKTLFPDYEIFKSSLAPFGFNTNKVSPPQFMRLQTMIANSYLRYKTDVKNYGFIAMKIDELYAIQLREQKIYDLDPSALMENLSTQEQKFFTINRSELTGEVEDDFLDNSTKNTITNKAPFITQMEELLKQTQMVTPELTFLYRLGNAIVYPLQHNIINRQDDGKGGHNA